jgi:hypothetical protein
MMQIKLAAGGAGTLWRPGAALPRTARLRNP